MSAEFTRRNFMKLAAGTSAVVAALNETRAFAAEGDPIKLGVVGCGGRGLYDTTHYLKAAPGIELVAAADFVQDRLDKTLEELRKRAPDQIKVTPETSFVGFDAYKKLLATDVNVVILTTPPFFRPMMVKAAVEAGKHVFMEKPVAVDPVGCRTIIEAAEMADQKNVTLLAGTQARRMNHRIELMKRMQDGQIGDLLAVECVRTGDAMRDWGLVKEKPAEMSEMEYQIRRWLFYTWLSGDFVDEMHVHELDIVNWGLGGPPEKCMAMGGRQTRTEPLFGDIFDHFTADFEYPNGVRVQYLGAQIDGISGKTYERFIGSKGMGYTDWSQSRIEGQNPWKYEEKDNDPVIQQFADQVNAIRKGEKLNEGKRIAESTLTAILCRISAYTGRELKFEWALKGSKLDLSPPALALGAAPPVQVAVPGKTQLV